ncbi:MAG TPA: methyl-accepting chemotaxis protein [Leptolyngbyaceae cyanobacterium]
MTQVPSFPKSSPAAQESALEADLPVSTGSQSHGATRLAGASLMGKLSQHSGRNLRQQLLSTVLPLALLPLAVEGLLGYLLTESRTVTNITADLRGKSLLVSEAVNQDLIDEFKFADIFVRNPLVQEKVKQGNKIAQAEKLTQIPVEKLEARFILDKQIEPNQSLNRFAAQAAETEDFGEIILTEANGFNVSSSKLSADFVQKGEDWWEGAKAAGSWIGNPGYDDSIFEVGLDLSQTITDSSNGKFLGVIKLFLPVTEFGEVSDYLANDGISGSQQVQVLDTSAKYVLATFNSKGEAIALTPKSLSLSGGDVLTDLSTKLVEGIRAGQKSSDETVQKQLRAAFPVRDLKVASVSKLDRNNIETKIVTASFNYKGKKYAVSTMPDLDWVAVASMDLAEVRAAGRQDLVISGLLVLALGSAAAFLATRLSRQLSAPLNELSDKALQVSEGNLDVVAEPKGSSETRTLASTFNELVFRVKASLREQTLNARRATLAAEITGAKVVSAEDLQPIYQKVVEEARNILGSERVVIYRFKKDWSGEIVSESVAANLPSAYDEQLTDPCIPQETLAKYRTEELLLVNDVEKAKLHPEHLQLLRSLKVRSILSVPIVSQGQLYGLLITHHCTRVHPWQESEVDVLKQLGTQIGLVIERVNLLQQTQDLAEEQKQIKEGLQRNALQLLMDVDPVSQGNLTVRAKVTEDEIGTVADSYNATIASLRKIVRQVQEAARQVSDTTDTNQSSVRSLSDAAALQAGEILAALERVQEMADSVRLVATNAEQAEAAMQQAAETVEAGDQAMNRTVEGFMAIRETVAETTKKVKRLGESSQKISNVVNLISGFAAQTNMLALNASIEASRAGEDGKGFAVVAEEVRELARQSAEATTEIEKLVASIQSETNAVVMAMEAGTEQVVAGTQLVDETRQNLNKITDVSRQISELVESIAQATVVQSQASETVSETMNTVAAIATQNSSAANEVSESFEQLRTVAQALQNEVARFKVS